MPTPRKPHVFGPAISDIRLIGEETEARWGRYQCERYISKLYKRIQRLADQPRMGTARDDLGEGRRIFVSDKHLILYRIVGNRVQIMRVLPSSMDLKREIERERKRSKSIGLER